jgi:large subunit ribosomal protein L27
MAKAGKIAQGARPKPKYRGIKVSNGESVKTGSILVRQKATTYKAGNSVAEGRDHTLFALKEGTVKVGTKFGKKVINVV